MPESAKEKISMFSHVEKDQVISMPDVNNIYKVPLLLYEYRVADWLAERLKLTDVALKLAEYPRINDRLNIDSDSYTHSIMQSWIELSDRADSLNKVVEIALVGKYTTQSDTYTSIVKALEHAGLESNRKTVIKVSKIKFDCFYIK